MFKVESMNSVIDPTKDYRDVINDWYVNDEGDLLHKNGYCISKNRLEESDWISHMEGKNWVKLNEFIPAYFKACEMAGITTLNIHLYGWNAGYKFNRK